MNTACQSHASQILLIIKKNLKCLKFLHSAVCVKGDLQTYRRGACYSRTVPASEDEKLCKIFS